jgi:hypothetical protein
MMPLQTICFASSLPFGEPRRSKLPFTKEQFAEMRGGMTPEDYRLIRMMATIDRPARPKSPTTITHL